MTPRFILAAALAVLAAPSLAGGYAGDPGRGAEVYDRCLACHALQYDRVGPRHCGLIGRKAGAIEGFEYSEEMKTSGLIWDPETLDRFLADPVGLVPGTLMTYDGIEDAGARADLIAYLGAADADPKLCPQP